MRKEEELRLEKIKEISQKVAEKLKYEINNNFPLADTFECANCDHEVYIMHEFERFPDLIKKMGIDKFVPWFKNLEFEIDSCSTCNYTLWFHGEYPEESKLVKDWILKIIEENS